MSKITPLRQLALASAIVSIAACSSSGSGGGDPVVENIGNDTGISVNTIDRVGRPGITSAAIPTDSRDAYNTSGDPADWAGQFSGLISDSLVFIDGLDGEIGNTLLGPGPDALTSVLVDDRLIIDTSASSCSSYLAVELGQAGDCGGRTLESDVIDDTLRYTVAVDLDVMDLAENDSIFLDDWPFLGEPLQNQ